MVGRSPPQVSCSIFVFARWVNHRFPGAFLASAAMRAAALNVFVNTASLSNRAFAQITEEEVDGLLDEYVPRAEGLAARTTALIRKG